MAEVDTSSYPKATLPTQKSALEQAQQIGNLQQQSQQIQSGGLTIEKQKLDLVNQRFGEMAKGFSSLIADPNLNNDTFRKYVQNQVKLGYIPPEMAATTLSIAPQDPKQLRGFLQTQLQHAQTVVDAINTQFGTVSEQSDNANTYRGIQQSPMKGGQFIPTTVTPQQLPPTQPIVGNDLRPGVIGPSGNAGPQSYAPTPRARPGLPVASPVNPSPAPAQGLPTASGPSGPTVNNGTEFNNRFSAAFPNAVATGPAPGVAEANRAVAAKSGEDFAADLSRAKNYQTDLYPMQRVLDIVKSNDPRTFGPGTDKFNDIKSALATWLPNTDQKTIEGISDYQQAKKYLIQAARSAGNTGTNDQLAAAFEANPNTTMNSATIENVVKSNIALRRMQHAQTLLFNQQGIDPSEYSKWIAKNQNVLDPRAFGFDIMNNEAKKNLMSTMATQDKSGNWVAKRGKEKDFQKFEQSLSFANDAGLIEPPGRK
jgi:hypothetical protein